ncbi:cache domain-containing protein [Clostridium sp. CCUG 7971]|uniref:PDC sensor domain-containing protein n=1 Tax=Clostridium sp. CCUG 7971 TaxID=2811414 RepID=UPI001ABBB66A|nr:cache domain-containing protein [Clostridium sp. CCUG 7971]MBO3444717.1 cache domain-containing protein [Clostridium sp. CCUG 7971]
MEGKAYMSSPVVSQVTGNLTLVVSAPIWENGVQGSKIVGVVTFDPDKDFLNEIVNNIKISKNSYAYLLNHEGTTIAHRDTSLIGEENTIKESATNKDLLPLQKLIKSLFQEKQDILM